MCFSVFVIFPRILFQDICKFKPKGHFLQTNRYIFITKLAYFSFFQPKTTHLYSNKKREKALFSCYFFKRQLQTNVLCIRGDLLKTIANNEFSVFSLHFQLRF